MNSKKLCHAAKIMQVTGEYIKFFLERSFMFLDKATLQTEVNKVFISFISFRTMYMY